MEIRTGVRVVDGPHWAAAGGKDTHWHGQRCGGMARVLADRDQKLRVDGVGSRVHGESTKSGL